MSISLASSPIARFTALAAVLAGGAIPLATAPSPALAAAGGLPLDEPQEQSQGRPGKARLLPSGKAVPPADAPQRVVRVIEAANRIRTKPYVWGGGHGSWNDRGYDCSGAVSYALHGGRLLRAPLASGGLMSWGRKGGGRWITVFANGGHAYAKIAGLRWDTSDTGGKGPRWHRDSRSAAGFVKRHARGL